MTEQWTPEIIVGEAQARELISAQFPHFAGKTIERFGQGWDNVAYLVDDGVIFRFPQRAFAAPLIDREIDYLPSIASRVPIRTPIPEYAGVATDAYPWRFAGYTKLAGSTACSRALSLDDRKVLAEDLAHFLRALHDIDPSHIDPELTPLPFDKLDPARLGIDEEPLTGDRRVVHGDLYARHLLVDEQNKLVGVIDWGDVHLGNIAVDLSVVHLMIPPREHGHFLDIYGEVDQKTWRFARHRALHHASFCLDYATKTNDEDLLRAAQTSVRYIQDHC